ncbi:heterochromatin protein 1-like [Teleopsis dalmanni]|uniref:heterochromatin protein 1-like n=1 Tax=Teleopsis dalmanni TaxID=139649 RepID=UPI0018CF6121|nr:heterochromatin protein 1-like [Teleopsis dalmanni]
MNTRSINYAVIPDTGHTETEYEVEKISGKRLKNGVVEYEIKWKGYSTLDNTWERIKNLLNCQDMIQQYENKLKKYRQTSRKTSQQTRQENNKRPNTRSAARERGGENEKK